MLAGVCGPHAAPLRCSQTPHPSMFTGKPQGATAPSLVRGPIQPRQLAVQSPALSPRPWLESKTRTATWDKEGCEETAPGDADGDPTTRVLAPGPGRAILGRPQASRAADTPCPSQTGNRAGPGTRDLRPQTTPNPHSKDGGADEAPWRARGPALLYDLPQWVVLLSREGQGAPFTPEAECWPLCGDALSLQHRLRPRRLLPVILLPVAALVGTAELCPVHALKVSSALGGELSRRSGTPRK